MSLFRSVLWPEPPPLIEGRNVILRAPRQTDWESWAELREKSRAFLAPWEPIWPEDDLTRPSFRRRIRRYAADVQHDRAYPFFIFRTPDRMLVGGVTLNNIRRGVAQAGSLGYWMGAPFARQGFMSAALAVLVPFAHGTLGLRRVEAACLPHNKASIRLLEKLGFTREGYGREYLCIAGRWHDHILYARLSSDPIP